MIAWCSSSDARAGRGLERGRHQHADLVAVGDLHALALEPAGRHAGRPEIGLGVVEADVAVAVLLGDAAGLGILAAHPEQGLDDAGDAGQRAGAAGAVHVAGVAVAAALGRLGGVMDQQHRARTLAGDVAEHGGHRLDLLVGVLADLVGLDERVDDQQADGVALDVLDAAVDVGQADDVAGAVGPGHQQRPVGTAVHGQAVAQLARGHVPALQDGREPAPHLVAVVLVVVDPGGRRLVHGLAGRARGRLRPPPPPRGPGWTCRPRPAPPAASAGRAAACGRAASAGAAAWRRAGARPSAAPAAAAAVVVEPRLRVGHAPLAPGALDHPRHLAAGLGRRCSLGASGSPPGSGSRRRTSRG